MILRTRNDLLQAVKKSSVCTPREGFKLGSWQVKWPTDNTSKVPRNDSPFLGGTLRNTSFYHSAEMVSLKF